MPAANVTCLYCPKPHSSPKICFTEDNMTTLEQETLRDILDGNLFFDWTIDGFQHMLDPVTLCKTTKMKVPVNSEKEVKVYCEFDVNGNRANLLKKFLFTLVEKVSIPTRLIFGLKIRWMPGIGRGGPPLPIKPLRLPYSQPLVKQLAERQFIQQLLRESNSGHSTASSTPSSPPTKRQQTH
ncbi:hypothetical protein OS493_036171 [Desmophyllum pertusum]|uniref:Uncharacterized protein n=1 Tax=Desmophyllum pertusum TaxID=174260 RepID=A0A9W9ZK99_9CNID|nr:hypothetical protein OS493_036171 [Desmophyllum pertusum]